MLKQLFKYMSEPRDLLENGFLRLSQPAALNDPFEAAFCSKSLEELASHFDNSKAQDRDYGETSFTQHVKNRMHQIGVISFSENKENLLMWAHYADEHRGIVVGVAHYLTQSIFSNLFRADSLLNSSFGEEWSPFDGVPKPVSYRKGLRYRNDMFDYDYSNISAEGADRILYEVFMQKSDEWIYEQEHRVVLHLEQADRVIIPNIDNVLNSRIKEKLIAAPYAKNDYLTGRHIIDLFKIEDDVERIVMAIELAKLSCNPEVVYLMKLCSSSINNCFLGLKSALNKKGVQGAYACSTGYLDIWKATKNLDYYSLEFAKI